MNNNNNNNNNNNGSYFFQKNNHNGNDNGIGPCGACKFLRRKCMKTCVFAPYFEPDERGTADFEAVHRVFGAKNAAKFLLMLPANKRLDAVVSMCYEAVSRVKDPVYGCVAHVFNLQQQVNNLQTQLAYVQARLSILKDRSLMYQLPPTNVPQAPPSKLSVSSSTLTSVDFGQTSVEKSCFCSNDDFAASFDDALFEEVDIEMLARQILSSYLPISKIQPN